LRSFSRHESGIDVEDVAVLGEAIYERSEAGSVTEDRAPTACKARLVVITTARLSCLLLLARVAAAESLGDPHG
jgi:hypothetical protein